MNRTMNGRVQFHVRNTFLEKMLISLMTETTNSADGSDFQLLQRGLCHLESPPKEFSEVLWKLKTASTFDENCVSETEASATMAVLQLLYFTTFYGHR